MKQRTFVIYLCFFCSGAAGLVYEVVWARQLSLFLGITSYANAAVITAYMLGLALGSWWIGRRSDQLAQPLRLYAWLELGIGLFAAATPWLFGVLQIGYARLTGEIGVVGSGAYLFRFAIALLALLIPTFLMGGTLPLLVRGVLCQQPQLGPVTGRLYGINTLGATFGTALTGFVLLPLIGVSNSILAGVFVNLTVAALILSVVPWQATPGKPTRKPATKSVTKDQLPVLTTSQGSVLLAGFFTSGFAALLTQLAWIRAMVMVVGGSVYAFTITLTAFLAGIGIGSLVYGRWLSHQHGTAERFRIAAVLAFLIGLTTLASLSLIAQLPIWFLLGYGAGWVETFAIYQVFIFALCCAVMLVPAVLMGALFPLLAVSWTSSLASAGRGIGSAYAVNTLGTILGSLLGGLVLLPWLGIHYCIVLSASLYVLVAAAFWGGGDRRKPTTGAAAVIVFIGVLWLTPDWNREQMANGVFHNPEPKLNALRSGVVPAALPQNKLLYYQEGLNGTVAVTDDGVQKYLAINGKVDASSVTDLPTQVSLAQVGALMLPGARSALVIGLGSGITAGSLATHANIDAITVLEISPEVVAASAYFSAGNHDVLHDPRVNLVSADARNYVLATSRKWDLIISQPSNPWISGISNLFTLDFFQLVKQSLAPGGIMTQWFHTYGVSDRDVKTALRDFSNTYRYVTVWNPQPGDLVMTGSDGPQALDMGRLHDAFRDSLIGPELIRAGFSSPRDLLLRFLFADGAVRDYAGRAKPNTDDRPGIEFNAPRSLYTHASALDSPGIVESVENEKFRLPLKNEFTLSSTALQSHSLELEVMAAPGAVFTEVQTGWWLWRLFQPQGTGRQAGVSDIRELAWTEDGRTIGVQLVRDTYSPNADQRGRYLAALLAAPTAFYGKLDRAGDPEALWVLGTAPMADRSKLALFWTCASTDGGSNWYIVTYQLPETGDDDPAASAEAFADRFLCR